jgi:hypothetical protein
MNGIYGEVVYRFGMHRQGQLVNVGQTIHVKNISMWEYEAGEIRIVAA